MSSAQRKLRRRFGSFASRERRRDSRPAPLQRHATPLRGMRKTIAERMHQSLRDSAQLTITMRGRRDSGDRASRTAKREFDFTYTDLLIQAAARALLRHPRMNARLVGNEIVSSTPRSNIGLAIALEDGLIVAVIRDATRKSLGEIAALTSEARRKSARPGNSSSKT